MGILSGKKILVTSGTGFIGKSVIRTLVHEGANVLCLTRQQGATAHANLTYLQCDLRQLSALPAGWAAQAIGDVDYFVYLAASIPPLAQGRESLFEAKNNNLDSLVLSLEIFGGLTDSIVFASTIDVYGVPTQPDFTEETAIAPVSSYAAAKHCGETYVETYCRMNGTKYVILRFAQVYGPAEPLVRVTPFVIDAIRHDKPFTLNGSGKDQRRFLYVDDAAEAVLLALQHGKNGVFNIAGGEDISLRDLIGSVERVWGRKLQVRQINEDKAPVHLLPSIEKARREMPFRPRIDLLSGLRRIHEYYTQVK